MHNEEHHEVKRPPSRQAQERAVAAFNERCPVGTAVKVRLDDGSVIETVTVAPASLLGGHTAVVWLLGFSACFLLSRVTPIVPGTEPQAIAA